MFCARRMISTVRPTPLVTFARLRRSSAQTRRNDEQHKLTQNGEEPQLKPPKVQFESKVIKPAIVNSQIADLDEEEPLYPGDHQKTPHYVKINGWDHHNKELKVLGKLLSSKRARESSDVQVLESTRLIKEALERGIVPNVIVFSRVKLLMELNLPHDSNIRLFHIPYTNIKLWTDLTTSPGIMAAIPKSSFEDIVPISPIPLTLVCDNIRGPDNLGAIIRVAAAVGVRKIICVGCTDAWSSKSVRAGAGAHFHIPIVQGVKWGEVQSLLADPWSQLVVADLPRGGEAGDKLESGTPSEELAKHIEILDEKLASGEIEEDSVIEEFKHLPPPTMDYTKFRLQAGFKEVVAVIGGETEGVSGEAYRLCHQMGGSRIQIPLRNSVNSLNVISAASVVLFQIQQAIVDGQGS